MNDNFDALRELIENNKDEFDIGQPASDIQIESAENFLNVAFPASLKMYLSTYGNLAVGPFEYYGLTDENYKSGCIPNGVWFTAIVRKEVELPKHLFVIFNNEGDEYHCVDLDTEEVKIWNTYERLVVAVKNTDIFRYIVEESRDFVNKTGDWE